jgi:hypothetical protein
MHLSVLPSDVISYITRYLHNSEIYKLISLFDFGVWVPKVCIYEDLLTHKLIGTQNVQTVRMHGLPNLVDISALINVPNVTIVSCSKLADISPLRKSKRVTIYECNVSDISSLSNVPTLTIGSIPIRDDEKGISSLLHVERLFITKLPFVNRWCVMLFTNITSLTLRSVSISNVSCLSSIPKVHLIECNKVTNVEPLRGVAHVILEMCSNITDLTPLVDVPKLQIISCDNANTNDIAKICTNNPVIRIVTMGYKEGRPMILSITHKEK